MVWKRKSPPPGGAAWKESPFYQELLTRSTKDPSARDLLGKVDHVAGQAADISRYVVAFLPQYTDHGERHLANVLQFMGELAGSRNIRKLSALECALAILAAMTHDLGMVLDETEAQAVTESTDEPTTPEGKAWQTYRDGHPLWHARRRLSSDERNSPRAAQMLGQVKADYIRDSHARELGRPGCARLLRWLDKLASGQGEDFYRHKGFSFREGLAHLALSHGQDIGWLPDRLAAEDSPYAEVKRDRSKAFACGPDEVNWPWLSWLLRLADVMDCDASRTPAVLFEHLGITHPVSRTEWKKHLSIPERPSFNAGEDGETLLYQCPRCPDPFTEKAIQDILGWINDEITQVRRELDLGRKHFPRNKQLGLGLPSKADVNITERVGNYDYLDLHFRLDRAAVTELLIGEALYGEPDLALRELVQNSLDALHLRDLRLKLQEKLQAERGAEQLPVPVAALNPGVEPLEVQVSWDTPDDPAQRPWIQVADNGVGMSREVIARFLTQIGKSYYKSPDFLRERELMKRHDLICTTISQFGIGFLSAFMLAEDVELETRAAGSGRGPGNRLAGEHSRGPRPDRALPAGPRRIHDHGHPRQADPEAGPVAGDFRAPPASPASAAVLLRTASVRRHRMRATGECLRRARLERCQVHRVAPLSGPPRTAPGGAGRDSR
jgi:molecular chaperone HtpG